MVPFDIQRRYPWFGGLTRNGESLDNSKQRRGSNEPFQIDFFLSVKQVCQTNCPTVRNSNLFRVLFIRSIQNIMFVFLSKTLVLHVF